MSVKKRILAIQLAEKIQQNPEYAKKIGVSVEVKHQQIQKKKKQIIIIRPYNKKQKGNLLMTTMNATELAKALESNNIFSRNGFSREEYIEELLKFQRFASQVILGDAAARLDEVIAAVSGAARKNGATGFPDFVAGVRGLKSIMGKMKGGDSFVNYYKLSITDKILFAGLIQQDAMIDSLKANNLIKNEE